MRRGGAGEMRRGGAGEMRRGGAGEMRRGGGREGEGTWGGGLPCYCYSVRIRSSWILGIYSLDSEVHSPNLDPPWG